MLWVAGFVGMALSYGLSLNIYLVSSVQNQCMLANMIVSAERLEQYMHIPEEACEIIQENRPPPNWPDAGRIEINDLKVNLGCVRFTCKMNFRCNKFRLVLTPYK